MVVKPQVDGFPNLVNFAAGEKFQKIPTRLASGKKSDYLVDYAFQHGWETWLVYCKNTNWPIR